MIAEMIAIVDFVAAYSNKASGFRKYYVFKHWSINKITIMVTIGVGNRPRRCLTKIALHHLYSQKIPLQNYIICYAG